MMLAEFCRDLPGPERERWLERYAWIEGVNERPADETLFGDFLEHWSRSAGPHPTVDAFATYIEATRRYRKTVFETWNDYERMLEERFGSMFLCMPDAPYERASEVRALGALATLGQMSPPFPRSVIEERTPALRERVLWASVPPTRRSSELTPTWQRLVAMITA